MLKKLLPETNVELVFDKSNLSTLAEYFDLDFPISSFEERVQYFENLLTLSRQSLGLAHCIQHSAAAKLFVQYGDCREALDRVTVSFDQVIGAYSNAKSTDDFVIANGRVSGCKKWISNLEQADYVVAQTTMDGVNHYVYLDLDKIAHTIDHSWFTPIGMKLAKPGALLIHQQSIPPEWVLGTVNDPKFNEHAIFATYCFITNHLGIIQQLFHDIKTYADQAGCGSELNLTKLEIDIGSLTMMWQDNLPSLCQVAPVPDDVWRRRNNQLAMSKKTLISILQLILEIGVSYYIDAESKFSERFRDGLNYTSHMHPLYRFSKNYQLVDIPK